MIKPGQIYLNRNGRVKEVITKIENNRIYYDIFVDNRFQMRDECSLISYAEVNKQLGWRLFNEEPEEEML